MTTAFCPKLNRRVKITHSYTLPTGERKIEAEVPVFIRSLDIVMNNNREVFNEDELEDFREESSVKTPPITID